MSRDVTTSTKRYRPSHDVTPRDAVMLLYKSFRLILRWHSGFRVLGSNASGFRVSVRAKFIILESLKNNLVTLLTSLLPQNTAT